MKTNNQHIKKVAKQQLTITTELFDALKETNLNASWKFKSSKINKNKTTLMKQEVKYTNIMTQADLDRLFSKSKDKGKLKTQTIAKINIKEPFQCVDNRDLLARIKYLQVEDEFKFDKMLTGLPLSKYQQNRENKENQPCIKEQYDLTSKFKRDYLVGKIIGQGAYASVRVAVYRPSNKKIAIKAYQKVKIKDSSRKKSVRREIMLLQILDHPNIVKIYDVVETNNHVNIIMQYVPGISLGSYLKTQTFSKFSETECKKIIRQLTEAMKFLHEKNISHRDIKLENIILDQNLSPKIIDFGFSTCIQSGKKTKIFCGTPSYMAPQIVQKKQYRGENADIWALGVLSFVLLTGYFPFKGSTDQELYYKINTADYPRQELALYKEAHNLISKMFVINPENRISADEILSHPWLSNKRPEPKDLIKNNKKNQTTEIKKTLSRSKQKDGEKKQKKRTLQHHPQQKTFLKTMRDISSKLNTTTCYGQQIKQKTLFSSFCDEDKSHKKTKKQNQMKILELLKLQIKKRVEVKSKCKSHRL